MIAILCALGLQFSMSGGLFNLGIGMSNAQAGIPTSFSPSSPEDDGASQTGIPKSELWLSDGRPRASKIEIPNSELIIWGHIPDGVTNVTVSIKLKDMMEVLQTLTPTIDGNIFKATVRLTAGPGTYLILAQGDAKSYRGTSEQGLGSLLVKNLDPRQDVYASLPSAMIQSDDKTILDTAQREADAAVAKAGESPTLARAHAIHNFVARTVKFDIESEADRSATEVLATSLAVCSGYANLTAALLRAIGIPARRVNGEAASEVSSDGSVSAGSALNAENHSWNEAFIDGNWITIDTTWDAGVVHFNNPNDAKGQLVFPINGVFERRVQDLYFNPSSKFFKQTHRKIENSLF